MKFVNLGTRNKATMWGWSEAYSFGNTVMPSETKYTIPRYVGIGEGESNQHCEEVSDLECNTQLLIQEFEAGIYTDAFFVKLAAVYRKSFTELEAICQAPYQIDSGELLANKVERCVKLVGDTFPPMLMGFCTRYLEDYFTAELEAVIGTSNENFIELQTLLLTIPKASFAQQEEDALFRIVEKYRDQKLPITKKAYQDFCAQPEITQDFSKIAKEFGWFHIEYGKEPFTVVEYQDYLWNLLNGETEAIAPSEIRKAIIEKQAAFFTQYPEAKKLKALTHVLHEFSFILDHSKVITVKGIYTMWPLLQEVANRIGISVQDCLYLVPDDITQWLQDPEKIDLDLIRQRKDYRVITMFDGITTIYEGTIAREVVKHYLPKEKEILDGKVAGKIGYPGVVRGKVTVVHSIADRSKFSKGDILVTHDGTAELTIFLKEASAIVTDEGGIICHATIIAREMRTPCVVGTKIATKVFADGDLVEVDATKGTITKVG